MMELLGDTDNILKITYGESDECLTHIDMEFDGQFEYSWLNDPMNIRILREIDNAEMCSFGIRDITDTDIIFSIFDISTGAKALMLCNMRSSTALYSTAFGDNCTSLLLEIAEYRDITIYLRHLLNFPEDKFKAYSLVQHRIYNDYADFCCEAREEIIAWLFR